GGIQTVNAAQPNYGGGGDAYVLKIAPACVTPPADMIGWWPGDGDANDIENGNNGTLENGTTFAAGEVGQAFSFDGVNDRVSVPDSPLMHLTRFSLDAWVNPSDLNALRTIMAKRLTGTRNSWCYGIRMEPGG